ncbi:hypothetical protein ABID25_006618 [Mesorhizobium abyssinicae]
MARRSQLFHEAGFGGRSKGLRYLNEPGQIRDGSPPASFGLFRSGIIQYHYDLPILIAETRSRWSEEASAITRRRFAERVPGDRMGKGSNGTSGGGIDLCHLQRTNSRSGSVLQSPSPRRRSRAGRSWARGPHGGISGAGSGCHRGRAGLACSRRMPAGVFGPRQVAMRRWPRFNERRPKSQRCVECALRARLRRKLSSGWWMGLTA